MEATCNTCRHFQSNPDSPHTPRLGWCRRHDARREETFCCPLFEARPHYAESIVCRIKRVVSAVEQVRRELRRETKAGDRAAAVGLKRGRQWIEIEDPADATKPLTARVRAAIRIYGPIDAAGVALVVHVELIKVREAINVQRRRLRVKCDENGLWVLTGGDER